MDVRNVHGQLVGWLSYAFRPGQRSINIEITLREAAAYEPIVATPLRMDIVTNHAHGWTAAICRETHLLRRLDYFEPLPADRPHAKQRRKPKIGWGP